MTKQSRWRADEIAAPPAAAPKKHLASRLVPGLGAWECLDLRLEPHLHRCQGIVLEEAAGAANSWRPQAQSLGTRRNHLFLF